MWTGAVTNAGAALLSQWAAGGTLTITRAKGGSGTVAEESLSAQVDLLNAMQVLNITGYKTSGTGVTYKIQILSNATEYTLRQIGVYGKLGSGAETLLAIYQDATGLTVPSSSESTDFVFSFSATVQMGTTGELTVNVDTTALVTRSEMENYVAEALAGIDLKELDEHVQDRNNPHGVTAAQAGAATVDHWHGDVSNDGRIGSAADKLVVTGEGGKLATADYDSIRDAMNITPSQIGAAPTSHTHTIVQVSGLQTTLDGKAASSHTQSASTITSGTLASWVKANSSAEATLGTAQVRNVSAGTEDLTAGESTLQTGEVYLVYE